MALTAADIQRAYTVNAPIGEILGQGAEGVAKTTRELREAREKKDLENAKWLYETVDPLTVGMGNAADPHSNLLLSNLLNEANQINSTKGLTDAQKRVRIGQKALELKSYREAAMAANTRLKESVAAAKKANPLIDENALLTEGVKQVFFDENNQPRISFDNNIDYANTIYNQNPNKYINPLLAQTAVQNFGEGQFQQFAGVVDPKKQFVYTGQKNPLVQNIEYLPGGGAKLNTISEKTYTDEKGNQYPVLPQNAMEALNQQALGFGKLQSDYIDKYINTNKDLKDLPDLEKQKIAAWQVAHSNLMPKNAELKQDLYETPAMRAARSRTHSGGGSDKEPAALDIHPAHLPVYLATNQTDVMSSINPPFVYNNGTKVWDLTSQFPDNKFVIFKKPYKNNRTGAVRYEDILGNIKVAELPTGERQIEIWDKGAKSASEIFVITDKNGKVSKQNVTAFVNKYPQLNGSNSTNFFQKWNKSRPSSAAQQF